MIACKGDIRAERSVKGVREGSQNNMGSPSPFLIYQCALCHPHIYFQSYSKATQHLGFIHSTSIKSALKNRSKITRTVNTGKQVLINPLEFFNPTLSLEKLTQEDISKHAKNAKACKSAISPTKTHSRLKRKFKRKKSLAQPQTKKSETNPAPKTVEIVPTQFSKVKSSKISTGCSDQDTELPPRQQQMPSTPKPKRKRAIRGQPEIRLETLKASEIETLMGDLFRNPSSSMVFKTHSSSAEEMMVRKSRRKVKERFKRNYGELDSEDEEIIRIGSGRGTKPRNTKKADEDEDYICDSDSVSISSKSGDKELVRKRCTVDPRNGSTSVTVIKSGRKHWLKKFKRKISVKNENGEWEEKEIEVKRQQVHQPENPLKVNFMCHICDIRFPLPKEYLEHMKSEHLTKDNKYPCPHCSMEIFPIKAFTRHVLLHSGPRHKYGRKTLKAWTDKEDSDFPHKCNLCDRRYRYFSNLKIHIKTHDPKNPVQRDSKYFMSAGASSINDLSKPHVCPLCKHRFAYKHGLQKHFKLHLEKPGRFVCKFSGCGQRFNSDYNLRRHILLHTSRVTFQCPHCSSVYSRQDILKRHMNKYHPNGSAGLPEGFRKRQGISPRFRVRDINDLAPDKQFPPSTSLNDTSATVKEEENFRVELESVHLMDRIVKAEEKDLHLNGMELKPETRPRSRSSSPISDGDDDEDSGEESNSLSLSKESRTLQLKKMLEAAPEVKKLLEENPEGAKVVLYQPYNRNTDAKGFQCDICGYSTSRAFCLQFHKEKYHGIPMKPFLRPEESTSESTGIELICGTCGYPSKSSDDLATHIAKTHVGNRKFPCSYSQCGLRFKDKPRLDRHVREVHLRENKFSCTKCDSKFSDKQRMNRHMKVKHDPQYQQKRKTDFKCDVCDRVLSSKSCLDNHKRLHTNSRPLNTCQLCGQTCAGIHSLKRHIQYVHMKVENPYHRRRKENKKKQMSTSTVTESASSEDMGQAPNSSANSLHANHDKDKEVEANIHGSSEILGF